MKLDVPTREEAVALATRQRVFGLAGLGALFKKLSLGGLTKTTAAALGFGAIVVVALIAIGLLVTQTLPDNDEQAVAGHELPLTLSGESSTFLALLQAIPTADDTKLFYNDYAAIREILGIQFPGPDASPAEITAHVSVLFNAGMLGSPSFSSFNGSETINQMLDREMDLQIARFDQSLQVRREDDPCGSDAVLLGRYDKARIDSALLQTASFHQDVSAKSHNGVRYYAWPAACYVVRSWGNPGALVLGNDLVYWSARAESALQTMIEANQRTSASLADKTEYQELAQAFADLGVFTAEAEIHPDLRWFEAFRDEGEYLFGGIQEDGVGSQEDMQPYLGFAVGMGRDTDGTYAVLVYLHTSEAEATVNAGILENKLRLGSSYSTGEPWHDFLDRHQIEVRATVLQVKLHGDPLILARELHSVGPRYFVLFP
jgi:hypothetical protein